MREAGYLPSPASASMMTRTIPSPLWASVSYSEKWQSGGKVVQEERIWALEANRPEFESTSVIY